MATNFCKVFAIITLTAATVIMNPPLLAQQQTIQDGVYTQTQAAAGKRLYEEACRHCHDLAFFKNRLISFGGMTLLDYWYAMFRKMPADKPGYLKDSEYLEIIAYTLSVNGFPPGKSELVPSNQLGKIKIDLLLNHSN
ncbi:MAG: hypothetical protein MK299_05250 [Pseudomonadales bacterium]|nr:hypothetical protein [Pseudomonadales bacterium]